MAEKRPDRTLGGPHDTFWEWCGKGELRVQRCAPCGHYTYPPVEACEQCGSGELNWERMSGRGSIAGWCSFERDYYAGMLPIPWNTIMVALEEGPMLISNPQGFTWRDLTVGMPVKLAFIEAEDSAGSFNLPVFEKG